MKRDKEREETRLEPESSMEKPLGRRNFQAMALAGLLIVVGFLLMLGGSNGNDGSFNPDIFSTRRIVVGPMIAFLGFVGMAVAIICRFGQKKD